MVARRADIVFYNAKVYTFDDAVGNARAIAVEEGRIIAVGSDKEIKRSAPRGCEKVDLGGRPVFPGFTDSHTHFIGMGVDSLGVDLSGTKSVDEALSLMRKAAEKAPPGGWVVGTGWSESRWSDGRFITRKDLDNSCPGHPAVAHRVCGHLSSVNSRAIDEMKLDAKTPDVEVSANGELTGVLRESAVVLAWSATKPSEVLKTRGLMAATKKAHRLGVTSIHDNGQMEDLRVYEEAESRGKLGVRVRFNIPSAHLNSILDLGLASNFGSEMLRIGGVKIFCDGALGARTAALSQPFVDDPGNKGVFVHRRKELDEMVSLANGAGIQIVMHAIGDAGIGTAISSIAAAVKSNPRKDHRHRIEHLELPGVEHLTSMRRLGIVASMQPNFVGEWGGINGMYYSRLGPERAARNNPFREVLDGKVRLAFGSDCMPFSPVYGILSAVNAPHKAQRISPEEAIRAYTSGPAYAAFEEDIKGAVSPGKLGDLVVLSADPIGDPSSLASVCVLKTIVGGEIVYEKSKDILR